MRARSGARPHPGDVRERCPEAVVAGAVGRRPTRPVRRLIPVALDGSAAGWTALALAADLVLATDAKVAPVHVLDPAITEPRGGCPAPELPVELASARGAATLVGATPFALAVAHPAPRGVPTVPEGASGRLRPRLAGA